VVGRDILTLHELNKTNPEVIGRLDTSGFFLVIPSRVFNLRKVYFYRTEKFNRVLTHLAIASEVLC
jgi:hypothetical protein